MVNVASEDGQHQYALYSFCVSQVFLSTLCSTPSEKQVKSRRLHITALFSSQKLSI
jgi:hypothetical protein